jgi:peroxiredoxin
MAKVKINTLAPEFTSIDVKGNRVSLSDFTDRKSVFLVLNRGFS